jgi:uncharacterized protein (DUF2141 family)
MKFKKVLPLVTSSLLALSAHVVSAADVGTLTIEMQGIHANQGQAIFILMDSESSHRGKTPIFTRKLSFIGQQSATATFSNIPTGDYSAVIYHDQNGNGELDRYFFGKPKEPYGFSNDARNSFGIPDFDDSKFKVSARHNVLKITIK